MITEIQMSGVASFKQTASLMTDKKINLIYGLNGSGKSTISNFLYEPDLPMFGSCKRVPNETPPVLVYNQKFIQENFWVADSLKGIFSLSKQNKDAEQRIANATKKVTALNTSREDMRKAKEEARRTFAKQKLVAITESWKIKTEFTGGDRVLEFCLEGLKGKKDTLFEHLQSLPKPDSKPTKDIEAIRKEAESLKDDTAQPQAQMTPISYSVQDIEENPISGLSILGNTDSEVASLIEGLGNADWVKQGLEYLPEDLGENAAPCPFCQVDTITSKFKTGVMEYFDESYQQQIDTLESLHSTYLAAFNALPNVDNFTKHPLAREHGSTISERYNSLKTAMQSNIARIESKKQNPKTPIELESTEVKVDSFNETVAKLNKSVSGYNDRLKNRDASLEALRSEFWQLMRWDYDQTLSRFALDLSSTNKKLDELGRGTKKVDSELVAAGNEILEAQKDTVNVDAAVDAINAGLLDLGIDDFHVHKHTETRYRVIRENESVDAFQTLSEGEKAMISFLYFCELCKGKSSAEETATQRIVVIDDPISSMSHVFIFNVGRLIKSVFFEDERYSQVIVLTHSLYFFYELTETRHERRKETQRLFRLSKPASGSSIQKMKYEEIQNDYQAYWSVVNDPNHPPALIANCMRNIVEYFFNFVGKKDLNNVFRMSELQDIKFQAFYRYINRESHSLGQNIIDLKEFDYEMFKSGLKLVFEATGYSDHFRAMSKLR